MRINSGIVLLFLSAILAVQGWMLSELVNLKTTVAVLAIKVESIKR